MWLIEFELINREARILDTQSQKLTCGVVKSKYELNLIILFLSAIQKVKWLIKF